MNVLKIAALTGCLMMTAVTANTVMADMPHGGCGMDMPPMAGMSGKMDDMKAKMDNMKAKMEAHQADLKLSSAQEAAWTAFVATSKPPMPPVPPSKADCDKMKAEMDALTKPQRMEKHLAEMDKHRAEMATRLDGVKKFYAQLTPEQQKVFDAEKMPMPPMMHEKRGMMGKMMDGMMGK